MTSAAPETGDLPRARLFAAAVIVLVLQVAVVSQVPPFSGSADLVPLAAMSVGLLLGSLPGAVFGFGIGLAMDFMLVKPLGEFALIDLAIGYAAGRIGELRPPSRRLFLIPLGAAAAAFSSLGYGVLQVLFGQGANLSATVLQQAAWSIIWGGALAVPLHALLRRIVSVPTKRSGGTRRRAYATGGLSPLTPGKRR